jgi:hypothetical protein
MAGSEPKSFRHSSRHGGPVGLYPIREAAVFERYLFYSCSTLPGARGAEGADGLARLVPWEMKRSRIPT